MGKLAGALVGAAILAGAIVASPLWATADGPDAWRVVGVASNDVLNARIGPGTEYFVIDALAHDARGLQQIACVPSLTEGQYFNLNAAERNALADIPRWCLMSRDGAQVGWVNATYLAEDS